MAKMISPLTGTLQSIKKQFISKEKLLKSTLNVQKKRINLNRSNAERERFIDYEKVLERPLRSLGTGIKSVVGKRLGFLDTLKTFIVNLLLGFIALRLLKYLPQLIQFATTALKVGNFILDIGGKILNGLVTFVDYGYKAYDHARKIVGKVGGEKAVANLDKATDETTKVMNQLFIAAMLFSDFSPFAGLSGAPKAMEAAADAIKNKVSGEVANAATDAATKTAGKAALGPIGSAGIIIGAGLLFSAAGEGVFQLTKWTKGLIGFGPISQIFSGSIGILEGVGTIFDIVGAPFRYGIELIRAGFMKMFNMKDGLEKQAKNLGKFDARIRENFRRLSGVFAPVFSFFGQQDTAKKLSTPGSFGSLYGEKAVKDMGYSGGGKVISVRKYAAGGPVNIPRTEVKEVDIPRGETIKQAPTKPGASIGGKERFAEVFPDSGNDTSKMDRYGYMISSYKTISGIPDLGSVFALTTKTLLGDQVTKDDYDRASSSLSSFMLRGLNETNPEAYQKFSSLIDIKQFNRAISGFLMKSMSMPLGGIINLLKIQVGLIPKPGEDVDTTKKDGESSSGGDATDAVGGARLFMAEGFPMLAAAILAGNVQAESAWKGQRTPWVLNDGAGTNKGLISWNRSRIVNGEKFLGKPLETASNAEQVKWIKEELRQYGLLDEFMDPTRTEDQLKSDSYKYIGWGVEGDRWKQSARILAALEKGEQGTFTKIKPVFFQPTGASAGVINDREWNTGIPLSTLSTKNGQTFRVATVVSGQFKGFISDLEATGYKIKSIGGVRDAGTGAGSGPADPDYDKERYSHPYGASVDINPNQNPFGKSLVTDMPTNIVEIAAKHGLGWGGNFRSVKDAMHFSATQNEGGNRDFSFFKQSGRMTGGPTLTGGLRLLHKGEFVIDKDSVDLFGGNSFFSMINGVENEKQRSEKSSQLIQHLSKYTGRKIDQRPEMIVENSDPIMIQGPPTYIASESSEGSSGGSSGPNWEQDRLELMA
jgi:hypothetical protein